MAMLPRLVGEARLGARQRAPPHGAGPRRGRRSGNRRAPARGRPGSGGVRSSTRAPSPFRRCSSPRCGAARAPVGHRRDRRHVAQSSCTGSAPRATTPFVVPLFVVVAMVEFTYGAQTVQLVLYAASRLDLGAGGYGYLLAAAGVGGLLSAIVNGRLATSTKVVGHRRRRRRAVLRHPARVRGRRRVSSWRCGDGASAAPAWSPARWSPRPPSPGSSRPTCSGRVMGVFDGVVGGSDGCRRGARARADRRGRPCARASSSSASPRSLVTVVLPRRAPRTRRAEPAASGGARLAAWPSSSSCRSPPGVPRLVLEQLASASQMCPLPPGVDVVVEGRPAHAFYAVVDGRVLVHRERRGGGPPRAGRATSGSAACSTTLRGTRPSPPRCESTILRLEGDVLLDALQSAATIAVCARSLERAVGRAPVAAEQHRSRRRPGVGGDVSVARARRCSSIGAGYPGKRRAYERMAELGARLVVVDEPGHWSESLVADGVRGHGSPCAGRRRRRPGRRRGARRPRRSRRPTATACSRSGRTACAWRRGSPPHWGCPGNPPEAVDAARSKIRTRELSAQLGLPTPRAQRVRSLDELFAAADHVGFPAVVKPEFGASAMGCVRVDELGVAAGGVLAGPRCREPRAQRDLPCRQRSAAGGVPRRRRVRRRPRHARRGVRVLRACRRTGRQPSRRSRRPACTARPTTTARPFAASSISASRRSSRSGSGRGVLHVEGKCTSHGPRIIEVNARMGGGADPRDRRGRVGRRPRRGATSKLPGAAAHDQAEPPAAVRRRQHDRACARDGSPGGPAVRRQGSRLRGSRDRSRSGGRRPRGRARPGLRDRAGRGDPRRQEPPACESADRGSAVQSTAGRAWVATRGVTLR